MDRKIMKRLQKIGQRVNMDQTEVASEFISTLKQTLAKRGYRADLSLTTDARSTAGHFCASVRFDKELGYPSDKDLMTLVAQSYPQHEIDWELAQVDPDMGIVVLNLEPSVECVPVKDINSIPPDFKSIGAGLYKRAADTTGKVHEIWTLSKGDEGLVLYKNNKDLDIQAEEEGFKAGDVVMTADGRCGRIIKFDDFNNAFVQIGKQKQLVAATELQKYSIEDEKKKLTDFYTQIYGPDFASALTNSYGDMYDKNKKRK
jgi:hypothetical protein